VYVILGGTGHVGGATASALLESGQPVTIVTRDAAKAEPWVRRGANVAIADVGEVDRLRQILRRGTRAFLLNPPANPATDTDAVERHTVRCILEALDGSGLQKVVAESTYGARPGDALGDLSVLFELEEGLRAQPIAAAIIRGAYYMSNWDALLAPARATGSLPTLLPADLAIPMVAPVDIGRVAARLLMEPADRTGLTYVEGPSRYCAADVAEAFGNALGRQVEPQVVPRDQWEQSFRSLNFSAAAARSYARMTGATVDGLELPSHSVRGTVTLRDYILALTERAAA
jgi:uncharacterized protein YbjT (DUF2867 family)